MMRPIHIFRAGEHTDTHGHTLDLSEQALATLAAQYSPAVFEAPLVVGHPELNSPAYGWVERLTANAAGLWAHPHQLDPVFSEAVQEGRYKKVSASFYLPDSPRNPKPGALYLRHVGFLGGAAPAVKGLIPVSFSEADGAIEFADIELATQENPMPPEQSMTSAPELDALKAKAAALEAENAALRAEALTRAVNAQHAEHVAALEALVREGRVSPGMAPVLVAVLDVLAVPGATPLNFGEGDTAQPLPKALLSHLQCSPPVVSFAEISRAQGNEDTGEYPAFVAPAGFSYDASAAARVARAKARMKTTPTLSFAEALEAEK